MSIRLQQTSPFHPTYTGKKAKVIFEMGMRTFFLTRPSPLICKRTPSFPLLLFALLTFSQSRVRTTPSTWSWMTSSRSSTTLTLTGLWSRRRTVRRGTGRRTSSSSSRRALRRKKRLLSLKNPPCSLPQKRKVQKKSKSRSRSKKVCIKKKSLRIDIHIHARVDYSY